MPHDVIMDDAIEIISSSRPLDATITPPGSKSITNRALLLVAMAHGRSRISGALLSDDTRRMAAALTALGFELAVDEPGRLITVVGQGGNIPAAGASLDAGNAGTAMRFLAGFVTLGRGRFRIDGSARMRERPIAALLDALRALGVAASSETGNDCPPIMIDTSSAPFAGGAATIDATLSSQFVSALLMPAPLWRDGLRLTVVGETARPFIDMTLRLMAHWGASSSFTGDLIVVPGGQRYHPMDFAVEPDASGASYFAAAAAVGGTVTLRGLRQESVQGDTEFFAILEKMGARVTWHPDRVEVTGTGALRGVDVAMNAMPDMVPTLAAIAPFASTPTRIRGVGFIRHHESDRIAALATELRRLGAAVEEYEDGLGIAPSPLHGATVATYDDHRIAMAFAVVGLKVAGVRISNPGCVAKTYPDFFRDLATLYA
ncbi:MAG: 3-phosphoshikimate 1-carboxyvinyltransferase [Candidatus Binataceae bacterium]